MATGLGRGGGEAPGELTAFGLLWWLGGFSSPSAPSIAEQIQTIRDRAHASGLVESEYAQVELRPGARTYLFVFDPARFGLGRPSSQVRLYEEQQGNLLLQFEFQPGPSAGVYVPTGKAGGVVFDPHIRPPYGLPFSMASAADVEGDGQPEILDEIEEFVTGTRPDHDIDRVLKTLLFIDIVGSTERAVRMGDRLWRELLDAHDEAVRRALGRFGGREVTTSGDGFLASFDGPARAIRCALASAAGAHDMGLEIRAGLHTGECEVRGDDLAGIAVHTGARVAALAGPSEVLVTSTVRDLVSGAGIEFATAADMR